MKFGMIDRMLQLGVVPSLVAELERRQPGAPVSLWQRDAKRRHRRILGGLAELSSKAPAGRQARCFVSLSCLLVGFHACAPEGHGLSDEDFDALVKASLRSAIAPILFGAVDYSSEGAANDLKSLFETEPLLSDCGRLCSCTGETPREGREPLSCTVFRCALSKMLVSEKRHYLLKHLCQIEEYMAATGGCRLVRESCIASGDAQCRIGLIRPRG